MDDFGGMILKKLLLGILISIVFLLGGCGVEKNNNMSDSIATEDDENRQDKFTIVEKIDLVGNDVVTINKREDFQRVSRQVFEKDGYTYFVEAIHDYTGGMIFKVKVSVLRKDKWIIKDKITDFSDEIGDTRNSGADSCIVEGFGFTILQCLL